MVEAYRTYQLRGYTTRSGYQRIDDVLAECAILYNACKEERVTAYEQDIKLYYKHQQEQLTHIRKHDGFWQSISVQIARGVLRRVDNAFTAFFKRCKRGEELGYPRWKSRNRYSIISLPEAHHSMLKHDGKHYWLKVKGLPNVKLRSNKPLPKSEQLKSLTITHKGRNITVNLTFKQEIEPLPFNANAVGLDMGVTDRVFTSDNEAIPRRKENNSIKRKQQRKDACKKGSNTRRKRVKILANAERKERIRNRNECHRITTDFIKRYGFIGMEHLSIQDMTASASGTVEQPGTNVAQKRGLNREILAQTWGILLTHLTYKAESAGRVLVLVDPKYTSQICYQCGNKGKRKAKLFTCKHCNIHMDADYNAALNILARAIEEYATAGGNTELYALLAGVTARTVS